MVTNQQQHVAVIDIIIMHAKTAIIMSLLLNLRVSRGWFFFLFDFSFILRVSLNVSITLGKLAPQWSVVVERITTLYPQKLQHTT